MMNYTEVSKFISLILRHKPEIVNVKLDANGWINVDELLNGFKRKGYNINMEILNEIVESNDKKRFTFSGDKSKIRANQGHSVNVDVELEDFAPPDVLYHGTSKRFLESIMQQGLIKQNRNHVHLSDNENTAIEVGKRHGSPVVIKINAKKMFKDGIKFYKSKNNIWLTEYVSSKYFMF